MKIAVISNDAGGLFRFRFKLIQEMIARGHSVVIINPHDSEEIQRFAEIGCTLYDIAIDRRGINPIKDLGFLLNCAKILKKEKPDKVITYTIKPNVYGGIACRFLKMEYFVNVTGLGTAFQNDGILKKISVMLYKTALKRASCVFFENPGSKEIFTSLGIVKEEKTKVLKGAGVDIERFRFCEYPQEQTPVSFLFIGRVMREKGVEELFEAACRLKSEYGTNITFTFIGAYEENYTERIKALTDSGVISYEGVQRDVRPYIEKCHCFVLPSYHEGMANTILESGAMGRPVITTSIHGCMEGVIDGQSGFLCNVKDTDDLYEKMKTFIELPYEEKAKLGKASYDYVAGNFDKKEVVKETLNKVL